MISRYPKDMLESPRGFPECQLHMLQGLSDCRHQQGRAHQGPQSIPSPAKISPSSLLCLNFAHSSLLDLKDRWISAMAHSLDMFAAMSDAGFREIVGWQLLCYRRILFVRRRVYVHFGTRAEYCDRKRPDQKVVITCGSHSWRPWGNFLPRGASPKLI